MRCLDSTEPLWETLQALLRSILIVRYRTVTEDPDGKEKQVEC